MKLIKTLKNNTNLSPSDFYYSVNRLKAISALIKSEFHIQFKVNLYVNHANYAFFCTLMLLNKRARLCNWAMMRWDKIQFEIIADGL